MIKRNWLAAFLLLAVGWTAGLVASHAYQTSAEPRTFLPLVQTNATTVVTLVDYDTTLAMAANVPGTCRVFVTYVDRAHGNLVHVTEDVGDRLVEVQAPMLADSAQGFVPPGNKHASGFPIVVCGRLRIYLNGRDEGDIDGPFKRLDMPIPAAP